MHRVIVLSNGEETIASPQRRWSYISDRINTEKEIVDDEMNEKNVELWYNDTINNLDQCGSSSNVNSIVVK